MTMPLRDYVLFAAQTLWSSRTRTSLIVLAMALGVASVIALTALGEGARLYVNNQFASLGTNLLIVIPGRSETTGINPSTMIGSTPRDLTLADAEALLRSPYVQRIAPVMIGSVPIAYQGRERESVVIGTTSEMMQIRHYTLTQGQFLQESDSSRGAANCVIGGKVRDELFGAARAETCRFAGRLGSHSKMASQAPECDEGQREQAQVERGDRTEPAHGQGRRDGGAGRDGRDAAGGRDEALSARELLSLQ